jgi:disulfide bond formation protein DsbB
MPRNTLQLLSDIAHHKYYWLALVAIGIAMESSALLYQYVGGDEPCILCIHVRLWVMGFTFIALLAYFVRHLIYIVPTAHLLITTMMFGLLDTSWELLQTERGNIMGDCSFDLGMPEWFAIDKWLPAIFEVRASCAESPELLFGITMAEALTLFSVGMVIVSAALTMGAIAGKR